MNEMSTQSLPQVDQMQVISDGDICFAVGQSGIGGRKENQDTYGGMPTENAVILTVCDGMGGMAGGQTASFTAVSEILSFLTAVPAANMNSEAIRTAISKANSAIYKKAGEEPSLRGMGTTATILVLTKKAAYLTHIGDSRIYQLRKGKKVFRTFDHSKVFEMVEQGMMTEEQARQSSFSNIITRALGIRPSVEMDVRILPYKAGDRFILCSDGIWNCQSEPEMMTLFTSSNDTATTITSLTEKVNSIGIKTGCEHDNLTVIIADMKCNSEYQYSIFQKLKKRFFSKPKKKIKPIES